MGGYLSIGQVEIVRYKPNAEAVFGARAAENKNQKTWRPLGLWQKVIKVATPPKTSQVEKITGEPPPLTVLRVVPTQGPVGTPYTITDPQEGRIQQGDVAAFYPEESPIPEFSCLSDETSVVSVDGTVLTGHVPGVLILDHGFRIRVVPSALGCAHDGRFEDLPFFVTST